MSGGPAPSLVCPACRRPPDNWQVDESTGTCRNPACATPHSLLEGTGIRLLVRSSPDAVLEHDDVVDLHDRDAVGSWLSSLSPGSERWERAVRLGMYADLHYDQSPSALTELFDRFLAPLGSRVTSAIDLGCGVGGLAATIASQFGCHVVGLDSWALALRFAEAAASHRTVWYPAVEDGLTLSWRALQVRPDRHPTPVRWVCGDVHDPPLPAAAFDLAIAVNLFDTVTDPALAVGQACALLRPGGHLLVAQPDAWTASATPPDRWLVSSGPEWASLLHQYGLETIDEADGFRWTLSRTPRTTFTYVSSARLYALPEH